MVISRVRLILEMIKFEHTLFALPVALAGMLLASPQWPEARVVFLVLLAMVGARSAAMAFNRVADAEFDARNPRTRDRPIPRGAVSKPETLLFVLLSSLVFFAAAYLLNPLCFLLSPLALGVVLLYSYTKRITPFCHLFLGLALAVAPVGGWLAVTGRFSWKAAALCPPILFWVAGFDVLYACMDVDFDRRMRLFSIPAWLGPRRALLVSRGFHFLAWLGFGALGGILDQGLLYYAAVAVIGALLFLEHRLVNAGDLSRIDTAFFTVNSWVSVVFFLGVLLDKLLA